jgi:GntR family transcriptional regulator, transcriptional repressor for pyruvate dehydrogenase complex
MPDRQLSVPSRAPRVDRQQASLVYSGMTTRTLDKDKAVQQREPAVLTPIERHRLSDAVVEQLAQFIESGTYAVGDKLPSERELARDLGVSRTLLRESFRILESIGLVKVKPGVGAIVEQASRVSVDIAKYLWSHAADALEVVEVRDVIAARAGELAAQRITDEQLQDLEDLYAAQREVAARGAVDELVRLDEDFHALILHAARNRVLIAMDEYSRAILNNVKWSALTLATRGEKSLEEHGRIVATLRERDARAAAAALRVHAQRSNAEIRKLIEERTAEAATSRETAAIR